MPIYEYQCDNCQQVTEAWQGLAEEPLTTCHSCCGPLKKLISMSSFHLKGGGWYADGYSGSGTNKTCAKAESCPAKSGTSDSSGASDNKPACGQGACCGA